MSRRLVLLGLCLSHWNLVEAQIGGAPPGQPPSRAQQLPLSGRTDSGSVTSSQTPATAPGGATSVNTINPSIQVQGSFEGSTPTEACRVASCHHAWKTIKRGSGKVTLGR